MLGGAAVSTNDSAMLASHEERIQQGETFRAEVAATMAQLHEQVKQVGERVAEVGEQMKAALGDMRGANDKDHDNIRREVEDLKAKTEEHGKSLALLLGDRDAREKRIKAARKAGIATLLTLLGAIATKWGEAIYNWLTGSKG